MSAASDQRPAWKPAGLAGGRFRSHAWAGIAFIAIAAKLGAYTAMAGGAVGAAMCQWDCHWYVSIVEQGYDAALRFVAGCCWQANWAFFPLLPMLVAAIRSIAGGSTALIGVLVSSACLLVFVIAGARLREATRGPAKTGSWIAFVLCWPFSFYFQAFYTEALFAALATLALLSLARDRVWPAAIATAALTATRPTGVVLVAWIGLRQLGQAWRAGLSKGAIPHLLPVAIAPVGLLAFMAYLAWLLGDPLAFQSVQEGWGRTGGNPVSVLFAPFRNLLDGRASMRELYLAGWAMLGFGAAAWLALKHRMAEAWLCGAPILLALSSGDLTSMPRFVVTNPAFLLAAADWFELVRRPAVRWVILAGMATIQVVLLNAWFGAARFLM